MAVTCACCGTSAGRRLAQEASLPSPPPPQVQPQTVQEPPLGVVVGSQAYVAPIVGTNRSCIVVPHGLLPGPVSLAGDSNPQPTLDECALSCLDAPKCLVFNWCPANQTEKCPMAWAGGEPLSPASCEHRSPAVVNEGNSVSLLEYGPQVLTVGGFPVTIDIPSIPGYTSLPGQVLLTQYRLLCPGKPTLRNDSCRLLGTAQELVAACDANPSCQAVEFSPLGRDAVNASVGSLKGTPGDRNALLDLRQVAWNPRGVLLVRNGVPLIPPDAPPDAPSPSKVEGGISIAGSSGSGLSGGAIAGIAVGATAAAAAAGAAAAFVVLQRRRRRDREELASGGLQPPLLPTTARSSGLGASNTGSSEQSAVTSSSKTGNPAGPASPYSPYAIVAPPLAGVPPHLPGRPGRSASPVDGSEQQLPGSGGGSPPRSSGATSASTAQAAGPAPWLAPWARQLLSESTAGWEEAVVQESEIMFLRGQDGQPICLGSGGFGSVWKVMIRGHTLAAAKVVEWGDRSRSQVEFIQEAAMLRGLRHPNIVQFLSLCVSERRGILLMEFCSGRDLDAAMHTCSRASGTRLFNWYNRGRKVAIEIASGLAYLHHRRILHLDLKPHNVLMASDGTAKIGDVGFARLMHRTHLTVSGRFGTFDWAAPEVLLGRGATEKSDIYSFGILLNGILTGDPPRRGQMPPLRVPEHCPAEVEALYKRCIAENPDDRPTAAELLDTLLRLAPTRRRQGKAAPDTPPQLGGRRGGPCAEVEARQGQEGGD
ncbi:hypothetical protein ABPG77_000541 [Micractinium sp. CCAP 211/92]